jgi:hypothetical protein
MRKASQHYRLTATDALPAVYLVYSSVLTLLSQSLLVHAEKHELLGGHSRGQTTPLNHAQSTGRKMFRPEIPLHKLQNRQNSRHFETVLGLRYKVFPCHLGMYFFTGN